jgi:hypothetical protein
MPDHPTNIATRKHGYAPTLFGMAGTRVKYHRPGPYTEKHAAASDLKIEHGPRADGVLPARREPRGQPVTQSGEPADVVSTPLRAQPLPPPPIHRVELTFELTFEELHEGLTTSPDGKPRPAVSWRKGLLGWGAVHRLGGVPVHHDEPSKRVAARGDADAGAAGELRSGRCRGRRAAEPDRRAGGGRVRRHLRDRDPDPVCETPEQAAARQRASSRLAWC